MVAALPRAALHRGFFLASAGLDAEQSSPLFTEQPLHRGVGDVSVSVDEYLASPLLRERTFIEVA
jgi:hypothetical protein